jgi:hypothetical protein
VILIPEEISLYVSLLNLSKKSNSITEITEITEIEKSKYYKKIEPVFILNKGEILKKSSLLFNEKETEFNDKMLEGYNQLAITTEITVYKNEKLNIDESGLTIPLLITYFDNKDIKGIITKYFVNDKPGLDISIIR